MISAKSPYQIEYTDPQCKSVRVLLNNNVATYIKFVVLKISQSQENTVGATRHSPGRPPNFRQVAILQSQ
jgi:hypothetical protein